jgi:CBS domain-containing protein
MNIFDDAIEMHVQWKTALKKYIEESIPLDIKKAADSHACDLGKWIDREGSRYNHLSSFEAIGMAHEQFHRIAAEVIAHGDANDKMNAKLLIATDGALSQSSNKLIKALMDCSRELANSKGLVNPLVISIKSRLKVKDILKNKENPNILSTDGRTTARDAIKMMVDNNIGSIAVYQDNKFLGIFTERGYMQQLVLKDESCLETPVSDMIDANTIYIDPDDSIDQCMILMTSMHARHLPVMDQDKLIGMISIGDIVKKMISDYSNKISQLEDYIHSYGV